MQPPAEMDDPAARFGLERSEAEDTSGLCKEERRTRTRTITDTESTSTRRDVMHSVTHGDGPWSTPGPATPQMKTFSDVHTVLSESFRDILQSRRLFRHYVQLKPLQQTSL
uniref:Uncharacterized protein n=1 Tax=Knipowitschia caucasica TaxID=637954 RepID=A0AAV2M2N1_KNICA